MSRPKIRILFEVGASSYIIMKQQFTHSHGMHTRISQIAAALAIIGLVAYNMSVPAEAEPTIEIESPRLYRVAQSFRSLPIEAKAFVVYDLAREAELYSRNSDEVLALASLTKIMTAHVAARSLSADDVIELSKSDIQADGDNGLLLHERWRVQDLLDITLSASSNDGAHAIASAVEATLRNNVASTSTSFVDLMNARANELGLSSMFYINPTGLDEGDRAGGYASASDIVKLFSYILRDEPEVLSGTTSSVNTLVSVDGKEHVVENTNTLVESIPRLIAAKTGYTDLAGGNLIIGYDAGLLRPFIIVVLGSSYDGRFHDMELLMEGVNEYISQ